MGYYGLLVGLQFKNDLEWEKRISSGNYNKDQEVYVKIPASQIAGYTEPLNRYDGVFESEGSVYKLIRQRVHRDTFHIVAVKDQTGTFIKHAIAEYAQTFSDHTSNHQPQSLIILPIFLRDYLGAACTIQNTSMGWTGDVVQNPLVRLFIDSFAVSVVHPPNNIA